MEANISSLVARRSVEQQLRIEELARRIEKRGVPYPVGVEKTEDGLVIVDGWDTVEAMKLLGRQKVPVETNRLGGRPPTLAEIRALVRRVPAYRAVKYVRELEDGRYPVRYLRTKYALYDQVTGEFIADVIPSDLLDEAVPDRDRTHFDVKKGKAVAQIAVYGPTIIRTLLARIDELETQVQHQSA